MEVASSNPVTVLVLLFFRGFFSILNFLLIYLFIDIIHYRFKTILVDKYRFNDCKQCNPIELMHSVVSRIYVPCLIMSHLMGTLYKCLNCFPIMLRGYM